MRSNRKTGILLVAVSAVAFGIMPIFAKIAYAAGTSVYTLLFLRFFVGAVFMISLMLAKKLPIPSPKEIVIFLLLGAIGYMGQSFCYFTALNYTTTATVSILLYTYPTLVTVGSVLVLKEELTPYKVSALIIALAGTFCIVGGKISADLIGILLSVGAAVIYTVYILVSSVYVKDGMGIQASAFVMVGAAASFLVMNLFKGFDFPDTAKGYFAAVMIALICTVLALWSFFTGMELTGPSTASLVSTLEPLVTVLASVFILSEKMTLSTVLGGVFILVALLITVLAKNKGKTQ